MNLTYDIRHNIGQLLLVLMTIVSRIIPLKSVKCRCHGHEIFNWRETVMSYWNTLANEATILC